MQLANDPDARRNHAEYTYNLIVNSHPRFGPEGRRVTLPIEDRNALIAIAKVARAHWTDHALDLRPQAFLNNQNCWARLQLLGLLLAMADLLDLSPVRARYFRSIHRLYDLSPESELHQTMHDLVTGVQILPPNPSVPGALQFILEWSSDNETVRMMSDWIMQWFNLQWLQLHSPLYEASGGAIGWKKPWAKVVFNQPEGRIPTLGGSALNILKAERAEQVRINRNAFVTRFQKALSERERMIFLFPGDSDFEWRKLSDWCAAHARLQENMRLAQLSGNLLIIRTTAGKNWRVRFSSEFVDPSHLGNTDF